MNNDIIEALVKETDEEVGNVFYTSTRLHWEKVFAHKLVSKCVDVCTNMSNSYLGRGESIKAGVAGSCGANIANKFGV
jgi:hypothetical protein